MNRRNLLFGLFVPTTAPAASVEHVQCRCPECTARAAFDEKAGEFEEACRLSNVIHDFPMAVILNGNRRKAQGLPVYQDMRDRAVAELRKAGNAHLLHGIL